MSEVKPGDVLDNRFHVERWIGAGGMGAVFEARDLYTSQRWAIKVLHPLLKQHPVLPQRFVREAQAARALTTPHAVKVEATGNLSDGTPFIVMEFLDGLDLGTVIQREGGSLALERTLYLADQIASGLHEAHDRGIIHRDLKPENIFLIPSSVGEIVKIVDFGISKIFAGEGGIKLTQTGVTVGTPQYMPVEQLRAAKDLDGRVDVYALGVILFQCLAGARPYDGFTYEEVVLKVATTTAPPPLSSVRPDLPAELVEVVGRAMARDRNERFASMEELRTALAPFWSGRRPFGRASSTQSTRSETKTGRQGSMILIFLLVIAVAAVFGLLVVVGGAGVWWYVQSHNAASVGSAPINAGH